MTDDDDGSVGSFGGADDKITTVGDLGDAAGSGSDFGDGESLDGVDDDEVEATFFDSFGDVVGAGRAGEFQVVRFGTKANGAEFDLTSGFLARDVENFGGIGDMSANLHKQGGFADARLASEQHDGAGEDTAAKHSVKIVKASVETSFLVRDFEIANRDEVELMTGHLAATDGGLFVATILVKLLDK